MHERLFEGCKLSREGREEGVQGTFYGVRDAGGPIRDNTPCGGGAPGAWLNEGGLPSTILGSVLVKTPETMKNKHKIR